MEIKNIIKSILIIITVLVIGGLSLKYLNWEPENRNVSEIPQASTEQEQVSAVVAEFGSHLKNVPLLLNKNELVNLIKTEYGPYVSPLLLERWLSDPVHAPGRATSSPWPDRIVIKSMMKAGEYYEIEGEIVEMTSTGESGRSPVFLSAAKIDGKWLIGEYQTSLE